MKIQIWWIWNKWIWKFYDYWRGIGIHGALGKLGYSIMWYKGNEIKSRSRNGRA